MTDRGLNDLLKWSIENSSSTRSDPIATHDPTQGLNQEALAQILGGPSDADRMKAAMSAIISPNLSLDDKLVAFDNLEQLLETLDNANDLEPLGLWPALLQQLGSAEPELRRMAAGCVGTAVQNHARSQAQVLKLGAIPTLVDLAVSDPVQAVRKKAVSALSSEVRNNQAGLDVVMEKLPTEFNGAGRASAGDMEAVDGIIVRLREQANRVE